MQFLSLKKKCFQHIFLRYLLGGLLFKSSSPFHTAGQYSFQKKGHHKSLLLAGKGAESIHQVVRPTLYAAVYMSSRNYAIWPVFFVVFFFNLQSNSQVAAQVKSDQDSYADDHKAVLSLKKIFFLSIPNTQFTGPPQTICVHVKVVALRPTQYCSFQLDIYSIFSPGAMCQPSSFLAKQCYQATLSHITLSNYHGNRIEN